MRAALVVLAFLLAAPQAHALARFDIAPDVTTNPRIWADLVRAERYWNAKPTCPVTVGVMDDDGDTFARANLNGCRMWIDRGWWTSLMAQPRLLCNVIVHEYGHLLGYHHNHWRRIMRPVDVDGARWVRGCRPAR